ncbi:MAG: FmdE family protein [Chloroflexota bacterium]
MDLELWKKCVAFHGHECPGLAIGYRAALIAQEALGLPLLPATDEEVVCVTENDACGVDAVQVITGCTMGKGNLLYKPTGKMAFSFFLRKGGKRVRIVMKPQAWPEISREELQRYLLEVPAEDAFFIKEPTFDVPEQTRLFANQVCDVCGEAAPEHKTRLQAGQKVCLDCFHDYTRGW